MAKLTYVSKEELESVIEFVESRAQILRDTIRDADQDNSMFMLGEAHGYAKVLAKLNELKEKIYG